MKTLLLALGLVLLPGFLLAQTSAQPTYSKVPLTSAQIAVYHAFLAEYQGQIGTPLNLSDVTEEFPQPDESDVRSCLKDFAKLTAATGVHHFSTEFADLHKLRLVDAEKQRTADPEDAIRKGESVDQAVKSGFASGVLRVSEILFDPTGHLAALNYSFHCGSLCGNGGIVIFELRDGKWKRSKRSCGFWMS